ncbi:hypothetical protein KLP28_13705 [Nocardioidaceae bacterium]|nr:hypothetical protein KLP28_13705 [Nocardioidaceae bacterium]
MTREPHSPPTPAGRFYGTLALALLVLIAGLVLLVDVSRDHPAVRIGFSVAIAAVLALGVKDAGERFRARRAERNASES